MMKKLMMMLSIVTMLGGQVMAQIENPSIEGDYAGEGYTVIKDSAEHRSTPKEVTVKLVSAADGTYTMVLQGLAGNELSFEDVTLEKVAFEAAPDGSRMLKFTPVMIDVMTKDGQKFNGAVGFDDANSYVANDTLKFTMKFRMTETRDLYVFFEGVKPKMAPNPVESQPVEPDPMEPAPSIPDALQ